MVKSEFLGTLMLVSGINCITRFTNIRGDAESLNGREENGNITGSKNLALSKINGTLHQSEYPFLVAIGLKNSSLSRFVNYTSTVCSGVIIDQFFVVTTCSCFHKNMRRDPAEYVVSAGITPELGESDTWNVDEIKYHPKCDYDQDYETYVGNVALVRVESPGFTFDSRTQPMRNYPNLPMMKALDDFEKMSTLKMKCLAIGWTHRAPVMQKLKAFLISPQECVHPACNPILDCRNSNSAVGFLIKMNGPLVNYTKLATGAPLICNNTMWAMVDTLKSEECVNNIFSVSTPAELLYAIKYNFTDSENKTMFSEIIQNSGSLHERGLQLVFSVLTIPLVVLLN